MRNLSSISIIIMVFIWQKNEEKPCSTCLLKFTTYYEPEGTVFITTFYTRCSISQIKIIIILFFTYINIRKFVLALLRIEIDFTIENISPFSPFYNYYILLMVGLEKYIILVDGK